jgi:selenocysteine lyase/cysteine desulfurase
MNPTTANALAYKDAVFFSPHKFVGGVNTPGVLIAKKALFRHSAPSGAGGGAVHYVTRTSHRYVSLDVK